MATPLRTTARRPAWTRTLPPVAVDGPALPGARITRHAVAITLGVLATVVAAVLVASLVVGIEVAVDATGTIEPRLVWPVRVRESAAIAEILVHAGDTIRAGAVVARLDRLAASSSLDDAKGELAARRLASDHDRRAAALDGLQSEVALAQAEARLAKTRAALRERLASFGFRGDVDSAVRAFGRGEHAVLDAAVADVALATADVRAAQLQRDRARVALDDGERRAEAARLASRIASLEERLRRHVVRAPASGVVLTEHLESQIGAVLPVGGVLLEIGDVGEWRANLTVAEHDVRRLRVGDRTTLELDALHGLGVDNLRARITTIGEQPADASPAGAGARGPAVYRVVAAIDQRQVDSLGAAFLRPGYTARAKIVTRSARAFVLVIHQIRDRMRGRAP